MSFREKARALKKQVYVVYLAARHPDTPKPVKLLAVCVVAYAFSPIDLIPDFVPILGYLDEVILIPLAVSLLLRLTPPHVIEECRAQAASMVKKPVNYIAGAVIVLIWIACAVGGYYLVRSWL